MKKNAKDIHEKATDQYGHKKKKYHQGCRYHGKFTVKLKTYIRTYYIYLSHREFTNRSK